MTIGIVTTHYALNYGAVLQAFALQNYISSLGYNCEIIDYRPNRTAYGRSYYPKVSNGKDFILASYKFMKISAKKTYKRKVKAFDDFISNNINLSSKIFYTYEELLQSMNKYDVFICGSDQIWNLDICYDRAYFLDFKSKYPNSKYIAYAPSIASDLNDKYKLDILKKHLAYFDNISLREYSSKILIEKLLNKSATAVLDPVFIYGKENWVDLINDGDVYKKPYIFCYFIGVSDTSRQSVKILKQITGYDVVYVNVMARNSIDSTLCLKDISPKDFVSLIKNSAIVCTNSFHATAFSLIFEKEMFTILNNNKRNSRMKDLLKSLDLDDRLISDSDNLTEKIGSIYKNKISYEKVNQKLNILINESQTYLNDSLSFKK